MTESTVAIHKGLIGVVVDKTEISGVSPDTDLLLYRGYPLRELARNNSFEEVAYLLWFGQLPNVAQRAAFTETERSQRALPAAIVDLIDALPLTAHPMDVVRTAVSALGAFDPAVADPAHAQDAAIHLFSVLPAIVAYDQRRRRGLRLIAPRKDLGYSANFLWMTFGEEPHPVAVAAFNTSMILYAEHSFNASTFTARVIASSLSDIYSAVTGAIGALKGPLHGGANEAVQAAFEEVGYGAGAAERARAWVAQALAERRKIMGFGHRVYKGGDSRVPMMHEALRALVTHYRRDDIWELYDAFEHAMVSAKGIHPNLDYPTGPAYHLLGFDTPTFTPIFVASRVTGWTAHFIEQQADNALIRPLSIYVGPTDRHVK